jgi:hypothetical protein
MLLFRKMLHCKDGSWLLAYLLKKLTEVGLCRVRAVPALSRTVCWSRPRRKRKRRSRGRSQFKPVSASGSDLKLALGLPEASSPPECLAHKVDVQEPGLRPRAFDLHMLGELVVTLEGAAAVPRWPSRDKSTGVKTQPERLTRRSFQNGNV